MFVTTFYSYKGGVGRTMALANVAALLAEIGRRVLVVDFDLEAPGVPSYGSLTAAAGKPGIVDYVCHYLDTNEVPEVADYIVPCQLDNGRDIWVLPAGDNTRPEYAEQFAKIDWGYLYAEREGAELLDDMKVQWEEFDGQGFDYVLIDSRTGNTDIGGICTRQLPDAVAILFMPTRQNTDGLVPIVDLIRTERKRSGREIDLIFCPSNIPDLFDENHILEAALDQAAKVLDYGQKDRLEPPVVTISHWVNLNLLDLPLIVEARENSRLSSEYRYLMSAIIGQNITDREGAKFTLKRLPEVFRTARKEKKAKTATDVKDLASEIAATHSDDGRLAFLAAEVFSEAKDYESQESSLSDAIGAGYETVAARTVRAIVRMHLGKKDEALSDLKEVLTSPEGSTFEFRPAARMLRSAAENPVQVALDIFQQQGVKMRAKLELAPLLMQDRQHLDLVADTLIEPLDDLEIKPEQAEDVIMTAVLALIGSGRFDEALTLTSDREFQGTEAVEFNRAIAYWGKTGQPPKHMFESLADALPRMEVGDPNVHQCTALAYAIVGQKDLALKELDSAIERVVPGQLNFSCWTFLRKEAEEFRADVEEMCALMAAGEALKPPFLDEVRKGAI
ncbi:AAA family ATPase [Erythrobacter sp. YJ-T3-07]|nr:AAA family ATPase [Erythrobacter sp. YJ-T3-07]MBH1945396.1 AAA family ATPase [Erythrobacter sp. YJ-T3-07]